MATAPPMSRLPPHMSQTRLISARPARRLGSSFAGVGGVGSGALSRFVIAGWASGSESRSLGLTMVGAGKKPATVGVGTPLAGIGAAAGDSGEGNGSAVRAGGGGMNVGSKVGAGSRVTTGSEVIAGVAVTTGAGVTGVGRTGED